MRTVTNRAMMTHDHLCFPTNFVDNCSYIDFVIIGLVLKETIEWRVFLKMTRQLYLVVRLFAFVCLYLNTNMKCQRHSTCLSLRRCRCLRVSVCPSLPVCVCLCLSLCVRLSLFVSVSVSVCQSVGLSVCLSVGLPVRPSVGLSVCLSFCLSVRLSVCPCVCLSPSVSVWCLSRLYEQKYLGHGTAHCPCHASSSFSFWFTYSHILLCTYPQRCGQET